MKLGKSFIAGTAVLTLIIAAGLYAIFNTPSSSTVRLIISPTVGKQPLVYNDKSYQVSEGQSPFKVRDFRFYLSNVRIYGGQDVFEPQDSYHLVRFDDPSQPFTIAYDGVPLNHIDRIDFAIGVDPVANKSIEPRGDLDPNNRMAWNWEVGYKFILVEGGIENNGEIIPLVYHVGFSENYKQVSSTPPEEISLAGVKDIHLTADLLKIFTGETTIDLKTLPSVKFDKSDARRIADNYEQMVTVDW